MCVFMSVLISLFVVKWKSFPERFESFILEVKFEGKLSKHQINTTKFILNNISKEVSTELNHRKIVQAMSRLRFRWECVPETQCIISSSCDNYLSCWIYRKI